MSFSNQFRPTIFNPILTDDQGTSIWEYTYSSQILNIGSIGLTAPWLGNITINIEKTAGQFAIAFRAASEADLDFIFNINGLNLFGIQWCDGNGNLLLRNNTPGTSADPGTAGTISYDATYIYVCVATNTWKRVPLATW